MQERGVGIAEAQGSTPGVLAGLRVIELADEQAEYCGMVLAGLGATVIKIEPPQGNATRSIGPFVGDEPGPEGSLHFWHYNRGKRSVVLDLDEDADVGQLRRLLSSADVLLESTPRGYLDEIGLSSTEIRDQYPELIAARMSGFGDSGPWSGFKGSDLVHLALGGVTMNCGYDPLPNGTYDLPPIAPQMWHAYSIAGDQMAMGIMAAILYRQRTGDGQLISCAIHEAVAKATELDVMNWIMRAVPLYRQTCRHSREVITAQTIAHTKDGRWFMSFADAAKSKDFMARQGLDLGPASATPVPGEAELEQGNKGRAIPGSGAQTAEVYEAADLLQRFGQKLSYANVPWKQAQDEGQMWAPLRRPHENATDEHWLGRGTFADIAHPEHGRTVRYPVSRWMSTAPGWVIPRRAPLLGEDTAAVLGEISALAAQKTRPVAALTVTERATSGQPNPGEGVVGDMSALQKPFALNNIRILDFTWFLASAGGTRFLSAFGAESIKVEWKANPDTRLGAMAPVGGREARRHATGPLPPVDDPAMGGQFNHKNAGKRGISLNVRHPKGLEIARGLVEVSDVVAEGFSPGVMDRWGLGYQELRKLRSDIIYVQQSGMGAKGTYGRLRAIGPIAASFVGLSDMSGLPEPAMPAGWGYSYLDWVGAYSFATAILTSLYHRERTGEGQWVDASQCEAGLFITGTAIPEWSISGRPFVRYGNRSPYKQAAPHGIYRCLGDDRWVAISCFTDDEWSALVKVAGLDEATVGRQFGSLTDRLAQQDQLDDLITIWTSGLDAYEVMERLQAVGVPAGVCQTAADRCDRDGQLAALSWLTEVTGTKIGTWPIPEVPVKLADSPAYIGGPTNRGAPGYGEDTDYILSSLLNYSERQIEDLRVDGVI